VIGPLADAENIGDRGSSRVFPAHVVTPLAGLRSHLGAARVVHDPGADLARAAACASSADAAVVVVGFTYLDEGEALPGPFISAAERGGDRTRLDLRPAECALIERVASANPRTVVVLQGGATITVEEWKAHVPAILMAFYPGERGGTALARVLFGEVNPSGKLPFTVPTDAGHLPAFDSVSRTVEYGPYHGYTKLEKNGHEAAFPFGHGFSYTRYAYSGLALDRDTITEDGEILASVDVTNAGGRAGEEIVQLYVGVPHSRVERPRKLLRGFRKVSLAPGETRRVTLPVRGRDLAYYDAAVGRWTVERVEHRILVGPSSRDSELRAASLTVVGR